MSGRGKGPSSPNGFYTSDQNEAQTYQAVCFAAGTMIATPDGPRCVETLHSGYLVSTLDHGDVPIRWVRHDCQPLENAKDDARPVLISAGALGAGKPAKDLIVSPQHRVLVGGQGQLEAFSRQRSWSRQNR